jgi:predicted nucleotidyltransferase
MMRLSQEEVAAIKRLVAEAYGPEAVVRLFGSRVDDRRRGGDVDLHVEVDRPGPYSSEDLHTELRLQPRLEEALGDRKVDLVVRYPYHPETTIDRIAVKTGIVL